MNTINGSEMHVPMHVKHAEGAKPKVAAGTSDFGSFVRETEPTPSCGEGCSGSVNQVDMEAFFAAWGTDNAEFDIDNNGIVDGADLSVFLGGMQIPTAGSIDDIYAQWGAEGVSTADLNGDQVVNGQDLTMALSASADVPSQGVVDRNPVTKLEGLLEDWGTDSTHSDYNNDGIVNGLDLAVLLGGGLRAQNEANSSNGASVSADVGPIAIPAEAVSAPMTNIGPGDGKLDRVSREVFTQLGRMGFKEAPPQNLQQLVNAFKFPPMDSKMMFSKIIDLFGGRDGGLVAKG